MAKKELTEEQRRMREKLASQRANQQRSTDMGGAQVQANTRQSTTTKQTANKQPTKAKATEWVKAREERESRGDFTHNKTVSNKKSDGTWRSQSMVTGDYFGSGRRTTGQTQTTGSGRKVGQTYDYFSMVNPTESASQRQREQNKQQYKHQQEQKKRENQTGEAGAQGHDMGGLAKYNNTKGEAGAQGHDLGGVNTGRTKAQIDDEYNRKNAELGQKQEQYNEKSFYDENYKTSIQGKRDAAYIRSLQDRLDHLKNEKPVQKTEQENVKIDMSLAKDSVSDYYNKELGNSIAEIETLQQGYEDWSGKANDAINAAFQNQTVYNANNINALYNKGRQVNPYRKDKNVNMTDAEMQLYDLLYALGLDDVADEGMNQRTVLMGNIDHANSLSTKLGERYYETDYIVGDRFSAKAQELQKQARSMPLGDARTEIEKQASAYKQMGMSYKNQGDLVNGVVKYDQMYETELKNNPSLVEQTIKKGKESDALLNMDEEDKKWAVSASLLGSLNRDDSYRAASLSMTKEERRKYDYLAGLEAEGKVAEGTTARYLKLLYDNGLNTRFAEQYSNALANSDDVDDFTLSSFETAQGFLNGVVRVGDSFQGMGMSIQEKVNGIPNEEVISEKLLDSVLASEKQRTGNVMIDVAETIGFMLPTVAVSIATGGSGTPAVVGTLAAGGTTFATTYGDTYMQTRREGYSPEESSNYAMINAALEAGLQSILTGVSSISGGILTDTFAKSVGENAEKLLVDFAASEGRTIFSRAAIKVAGSPLFRKIFSQLAVSAASGIGEFTEESLQEVLDPLVRNMILGEDNNLNPFNENVMAAGGMGFLVSMLMNAPTTYSSFNKAQERGAELRKSGKADALIQQGLKAGEGTTLFADAKWIQENPGIHADLMLGLLESDIKTHDQTVKDIQLYRDSVIEFNDLSDAERKEMVDPRNAKANAALYGVDINEKMSAEEIRQAFEDAHNEALVNEEAFLTTKKNLRSAADEVANTDKGLSRFFKRFEKLGGREVMFADDLTSSNGSSIPAETTRSKVILDSSLLTSPDGIREAVRIALGKEMTHLIQNTSVFNSLVDSAREYVEEYAPERGDWDAVIEDVINEYGDKGQPLSVEQAEHEVVGDYISDILLTDYESLKKFVYSNTSAARKILNVLRGFIKGENSEADSYVREAVNNLEMAFAEAQSKYYNPDIAIENGQQQNGAINSGQSRYASDTTLSERAARNRASKPSEIAIRLAEQAEANGNTEQAEHLRAISRRASEIEGSRRSGQNGEFTARRRAYRDALRNAERNNGVISAEDLTKIYEAEAVCAETEDMETIIEARGMVEDVIDDMLKTMERTDTKQQKEIRKLQKMLKETNDRFSKEKAFNTIEQKAKDKAVRERARELKKMEKERAKYLKEIEQEAKKQKTAEDKLRDSTLKLLRQLKQMPTDGSEYADAVHELIDDVYLTNKGKSLKTKEKSAKLWDAYEKLVDEQKAEAKEMGYGSRAEAIQAGVMQDIPMSKDLETLLKSDSEVALKDLSPDQVAEIYNLALSLKQNLKAEREARRNSLNFNGNVYDRLEFASKLIEESKTAQGRYKGFKKLFGLSSLNPKSVFNKLGGYDADSAWMKVYDSLKTGQTRTFTVNQELSDIIRNFETEHKEAFAEWTGRKAKLIDTGVDVQTEDGQTIRLKLTAQQRMSLYMHMQNAENLAHIVGTQQITTDADGNPKITYGKLKADGTMEAIGGMRIPDYDLTRKGKISEATNTGITVKPTYEQLTEIIKGMSSEEIAFCKAVEGMFSRAATLVNEVSVQEVGYLRMLVDNYFPIYTFSNGSAKVAQASMNDVWVKPSDSVSDAALFQARTGDISTALVLGNITDIANSYIDKVSNYVGLALPLQNMKLAQNVRGMNVGDALVGVDTSGSNAINKYLTKLTEDLVGQRTATDILDRMRSHYAQGVLGLNIGVVLKQAASYPTAASVVGYEALAKGFARKVDNDIVLKYSPYYAYRTLGKGDISLGDITSTSRSARIMSKLDLINKMDLATVKKLWGAAEVYVENNFPSLEKGTEAYYKKVGEMHGRIIAETQPNYTMLERPDVLRSNSPTVRSLLMFRTQLMQNYNLLYDSVSEYNARRKAGTLTKADNQRLGRTVSSQLVAAATIAAITLGNSILRGNDDDLRDEKGNLDIGKIMKSFGLRGLESFAGMFIGGSEAVAAGEKIYESITGEDLGGNDFDITMPQVEIINDLGTGFINLVGVMADPNAADNEKYQAMRKMAFAVSKLFGLPVENVMKYATGVPKMLDNFKVTDGSFTAWHENLMYGTSLKSIENETNGKVRNQKFSNLLNDLMPNVSDEVKERMLSILKHQEQDDMYDIEDVLVKKETSITDVNGKSVALTKEEQEQYLNLANKRYNELAEAFMNSVEYNDLTDYEKYLGLSDIADYANNYAASEMAKNYKMVVKTDEDLEKALEAGIEIGDYIAYQQRMSSVSEDGMKKYVLANLDFSDDVKQKFYELEFEKDNAKKTLQAAVDNGMSVSDYIETDAYMKSGMMDDEEKLRHITTRYNTDDEKAAAYHAFMEDDNTKYEDSIMYARDNGISPTTYLKREQQLNEEIETNTQWYTTSDLKYKDGQLVETSTMKSKETSDAKSARISSLLNSGYTDEEIAYFYQKEYPNDDGFAVGMSIGLDAPTYLNYQLNSSKFVADKDANGKSITGSKKAKIEAYINGLNISDMQKLILMMDTNNYTHTKEEYQAVIDWVNQQNLSMAMKLRVFDELGIRREGSTVYPEKAK